ncbi:MmoB/DmpM family protein [Novosphingobium naphthalenivorans]|uniref:MmoB/DmpM family protein n=1 Tax=Novosphingobium naphthalenivorans TaxID=273168 RepID=UPI00082992C3|nr:MmoB/DmpM family protein [Novosphingobium naphthalenivorans]
MSNVFIAFQANEDTRPIVEAILADNPEAQAEDQPAMVRVFAPGHMTINRSSIEDLIGRDFDLQELHINLITLSGHVEEDEERLTLSWDA